MTVHDNYPRDENLSTVWNKLIKRSEAEYICLLNTDVIVEDDWLSKLVGGIDEETGATGPITNRCGTNQGGCAIENKQDKIIPINSLSGFCLVFPKKVWEEVGGFNEKYKLYGEDSEFCESIKKLGYKLKMNQNVYIYHYGGKTTSKAKLEGKDTDSIRQESKDIFNEYKSRSRQSS